MMKVPLHGKLANGRVALVDDLDYPLVNRYRWFVFEQPQNHGTGIKKNGPYAVAHVAHADGVKRLTRMHKLLTGWPRTDHKDGNGLNNQRSNLRDATRSQNQWNSSGHADRRSRYKGVSVHPTTGRWQARIAKDGKRHYLGLFDSERAAALAYNEAALALHGEFARLNRVS